MTESSNTLIPAADVAMDPMSTVVDPLGLPPIGSHLDDEGTDPLGQRGHRTPVETAVDWFIDDFSDEGSIEDDLPRMPLPTNEDDATTLDRLVAAPPTTTRTAMAVAGMVFGLGGLCLILMAGTSAVAAGAAGVWYANQAGPAYVPVEPPAPVAAPMEAPTADDMDAAGVDKETPVAAAEPKTEDPKAEPRKPAAPKTAGPKVEAPKTAAAVVEPTPKASRPPIVAPAGTDDAEVQHTIKLITSPPAARILVDGVDHGRTPLKVDLAEGAHTLVFEIGGVRSTVPVAVSAQDRICFTAAQGVFATSDCL